MLADFLGLYEEDDTDSDTDSEDSDSDEESGSGSDDDSDEVEEGLSILSSATINPGPDTMLSRA